MKRLVMILLLGLVWTSAQTDEFSHRESRRDKNLRPRKVMDVVGLKAGMVVGEAGAGNGYFTFKLSRRVGPQGRVYANDISEESLDTLTNRVKRYKVKNIKTVLGKPTDPLFPEKNALDMVFMVYALHDFSEPVAFLKNLKAYLKPTARVVILDQDPEKAGEASHFLTQEQLKDYFSQAGYKPVQSEDFLKNDLICVFQMQAE